MKAVAAALRLSIDDVTLAQLCQKVENEIVGASCGIMDQMTAMMGEKGKLMKLLCQPCALLGHVNIPEDLTIIGIDSGERHSISGSDYATVRTATFMGLTILRNELERDISYLVDIPSSELDAIESSLLPECLEGQVFTERYGAHVDAATEIHPGTSYNVRSATRHPVEEIQRVRCFAELLESPEGGGDVGIALGRLMHAAHEAYQKLGLGSAKTDALYRLTQGAADRGIYGGKISGGGSGGTVCVLVAKQLEAAAARDVLQQFCQQGNPEPYLFRGSSNGAHLFGILRMKPV